MRGEGWAVFAGGRLADDGKRFPSVGRFATSLNYHARERSEEGKGTRSLLKRGWRMTGSAVKSFSVNEVERSLPEGKQATDIE